MIRSYHPELIITPYKSGIKLLQPSKCHYSHSLQQTKITAVSDVLKLPCNTYLFDCESKVIDANISTVQTMYLDSITNTIGKSLADTPMAKESVDQVHANDRMVIRNEKAFYFEEIDYSYSEKQPPIHHLSIKLPWFDNNDKIIGVLGFSIVLSKQSLSESLSMINNLGFFLPFKTQAQPANQFLALEAEQIYLTPRETELIKLIIKGMRSPEIASHMKLSKRTIEHYLISIKEKFNVKTKHELIEKVIYLLNSYHVKNE